MMYPRPVTCRLLTVLVVVSLFLLYYLGGLTGTIQQRGEARRQPVPVISHSLHRSLKTGSSASDLTSPELDSSTSTTNALISKTNSQQHQNASKKPAQITTEMLEKKLVSDAEHSDILRTKEDMFKRKLRQPSFVGGRIVYGPRERGPPRKRASKALFQFSDLMPNSRKDPVRYGLNTAAARLSYEFSGAPNASLVNDKTKWPISPKFHPKTSNILDIVPGELRAGEYITVKSARHILVATTWRSGSTFLGDLLNHYPGVYYYFEPLHYYDHDPRLAGTDRAPFLKSLFQCKIDDSNVAYLQHVARDKNRFLFNHNFRLMNSCQKLLPRATMCYMPQYLNAICPLYPIKLIKTVRLRVKATESLLQDPSMDLKIVVLVRDPRGTYNSRSEMTWCAGPKCADPVKGCDDLNSDISAAFDLHKRYPGHVHLVRMEDLSMEPEETTREMLKFLKLPWKEAMSQYINTHTEKDRNKMVRNKKTKELELYKSPYGTVRNSTATAFAWKKKLGLVNATKIQEVCREPMERLGYKLVHNQEDLDQEQIPIIKSSKEVWPFGEN